MTYKKIKKRQQSQKSKTTHLISPELIKGKQFKEIGSRLQDVAELSDRDRYVYGYSLFHTGRFIDSLVILWPLVVKGHTVVQEDCTTLAHLIFKEEIDLSAISLSDEKLQTLVIAATSLMPLNPLVKSLEKQLFELLWLKNDYASLWRLFKNFKTNSFGILAENLSKLDFFQPEKKLSTNIPAFIGHVLTGGACLILRDIRYHHDIKEAVHALCKELKLLFSQLQVKRHLHFTWSKSLFDNYIDYEAHILIEVLQLAVQFGTQLDLIPSPSYLVHYDTPAKKISEVFLNWLASVNKELVSLYHRDTYQAIILAFSAKKQSDINSMLKLVRQNKFHPYLRLALMLKAENIKRASSLSGLVHPDDFEDLDCHMGLYKNIVIQTLRSMADESSEIELTAHFWNLLIMFYPVLQIPELHFILTKHSVIDLADLPVYAYDNQDPLKISILSHPDPFKALDVKLSDSKALIMQKVMSMSQQSPADMGTFRQAQNELFQPTRRFLHQYLRYLAYESQPLLEKNHAPLTSIKFNVSAITFRPEFLNET